MAGLATVVRPVYHAGATANLLDSYGRAAFTCTADANGIATWTNVAPGSYRLQISFATPEGHGVTKTLTETDPNPTVVVADVNQQFEPLVQAPNGSVWRISVSNAGVISATQLS